ncbi:MAG: hypothetical protein J5602_06190 [Clostridia bacterium]|nr:hypothetical protein [Clostridia bacterium]
MSARGVKKPAALCGAPLLKSRITRYFRECEARALPATPAGLALALGLRTGELTGGGLPDTHRRLIGQALQRIETETLERALSGKGGTKGVDAVLQQTAREDAADALSGLSDEELERRLAKLAEEIEALVGGGRG